MKRVFFHIHIWKTGGTSFFNICSRNFGKEFRRDIMLIQNWFLTNQQLQWLLDYHDWIRCYSCHMLSGNLPYSYESREVVGLAFVRNPVDRFISSYNFQRGATYRGGIAKQEYFDAFIKKALVDEDNPWWRNGQTFVLGGSGTEKGLDQIEKRVKKGQLVLLPMERFDECCMLLERLFPDDFKDCSYTRYNVSRQSQPISEKQRAAVARYMDIDIRLLELANRYLDTTLIHLFTNLDQRRHYREAFQYRCSQKKRRRRFSSLVHRIEKKIISAIDRTVPDP